MKKAYNLRSKTRPGKPQSTTSTSAPSQRPAPPVNLLTLDTPTPPDNPIAMEPTLADLQKSLKESSSKVCAKLDDIHADIASMKKNLSDLQATVDDNSARVLDLETNKLPNMEKRLKKEIDLLKEKLTISEIYQRKSNLLFYGLQKKQNENVESVLREAFVALGLSEEEAQSIALVNAHRLPSKRDKTNNAPEPIIAKFVYMPQRNRLLSAFERKPQRPGSDRPNPRISVRTDLPPALKAERAILATKAYKFRKEDNLSTKIVIVGSRVVLFTKARNATEWRPYKD